MSDRQTQGIDATNQAFIRYDQVEKKQEYQLAEGRGQEAFDEETRVQTCDLGRFLHGNEQDKQEFARELGQALRHLGFAILENHGIDPKLYREAEERTAEVFTTVSLEDKLKHRAARFGSVNQGYFPIKETSGIHPDLVEGWVFCRRAFDMDAPAERAQRGDPAFKWQDFWPRADFEPFFRQLTLNHEKLILPVMQSILRDLGCDPHLYDRKLAKTNFGQRLNYYPPLGKEEIESGAGRMLGHEDVDLFTFLPAASVEGLQVLNRANMSWIRLQAPPGSIILNTGDYAQRISNDLLPSTTHRVSLPRDPALRGKARVSFPMAIYVWEEEVLEVLPGLTPAKYPPIKALPFHTSITAKYYGDDYAVK